MTEKSPQFLTSDQCAQRYNISERHFVRLVEQGVMPKPLKLGRTSRWSTRALEEFELRNTLKQTPYFDPAAMLRTKKRKHKKSS
jgi:predicted DNA-binding transcriptional regulator AlpA